MFGRGDHAEGTGLRRDRRGMRGGVDDKKRTTYSGRTRDLVELQPGQRVGVTGTGRIHAHPSP